jgi:selenophosphate synthetase-related protein
MFFSSLEERASQLRSDISALPEAAESGVCAAAKDVSMAGLLGSLAMLLEATRSGAWIDLEMLPRPEHVSLSDWTEVFPSYAFLLSTETAMVERCRSIFTSRGLLCEEVGRIDSSGILRVRMAAEEAIALDFTSGGPTRIGS